MSLRVVTAGQAAARDRAAIDAGTPSQVLMRRAGEGAAHVIWGRYHDECVRGVVVCTGPGNNGGDGWIVAAALERLGARVTIDVVAEPASVDARWARSLAPAISTTPMAGPGLVVDALLGTGARGAPRGAIAAAVERIGALRRNGATVVALDLPTGLDAGTGEAESCVRADLTVSFGTWKRGLLARRDLTGALACIDIGLGTWADLDDGAPVAVDAAWVRAVVPRIDALAHKGTRRRVMIVGAAPGMAGASVIAARGAFRSGVGMVRCCASPASVVALQAACPEATVLEWPAPESPLSEQDLAWAHALLIGPGFGLGSGARTRVEDWLDRWRGPIVVDADVLTLFAGEAALLGEHLRGRPAIVTPHAVEASRLLGCPVDHVRREPYDCAGRLAGALGATVVLKGVPTIVASPTAVHVVPRGTPVLATGGSGDLLAGIAVTLLAQAGSAHEAAAAAAFVHGRAAEMANAGRPVRGVVLADVMDALPAAWRLDDDLREDVELAVLPAVGERDLA